jgi:hypothetical protein
VGRLAECSGVCDDLFQALDPMLGEGGHGSVFAAVRQPLFMETFLLLAEHFRGVGDGEDVCDGDRPRIGRVFREDANSRRELVEPVGRLPGDASEHVGQPGLRNIGQAPLCSRPTSFVVDTADCRRFVTLFGWRGTGDRVAKSGTRGSKAAALPLSSLLICGARAPRFLDAHSTRQ